jgi:hypothetical protein
VAALNDFDVAFGMLNNCECVRKLVETQAFLEELGVANGDQLQAVVEDFPDETKKVCGMLKPGRLREFKRLVGLL